MRQQIRCSSWTLAACRCTPGQLIRSAISQDIPLALNGSYFQVTTVCCKVHAAILHAVECAPAQELELILQSVRSTSCSPLMLKVCCIVWAVNVRCPCSG